MDSERLALMAQKGDRAAHDALFERWYPLIRRLVTKYKGGLDYDDALSAGMQGYLNAVRLYRQGENWVSWLSWKVCYAIKSEQRKEHRHQSRYVTQSDEEAG